jgi:alpha-N-arabinofuranosidase
MRKSPCSILVKGRLGKHRISRLIYGDFMAMHDNLISGMRAEKIRNRKFEERDCPDARTARYWYASGYNDTAQYALSRGSFNGTRCQRITIKAHRGGERGIAQDGIPVVKGEKYGLSLYLRTRRMRGRVTVTIGRDKGAFVFPYAAHQFRNVTSNWRRCECALTSSVTDDNATLMIRFGSPGTIWVDEVSLVPLKSKKGWRVDVMDKIRRLRPTIMRFPGGCEADNYHWKDGIGPRDRRPPREDVVWGSFPDDYRLMSDEMILGRTPLESGQRRVETNDVGTDEYIDFCRLARCEPYINVNLGTGSAAEAAGWVEYCNGGARTKGGRLRAKHGSRKPYNVRYWEIGNETYGEFEIGNLDASSYARRYLQFARAMKKVDPSIKLIAVGHNTEWNRTVLKRAGDHIDFLDIHYYPFWGVDPTAMSPKECCLAMMLRALEEKSYLLDAVEEIKRQGLAGRVRIGVCEWNYSAGDWARSGRARFGTFANGLVAASILNMLQRHSGFVKLAVFSELANSWQCGLIQTNATSSYVTPTFLSKELYRRSSGVYPLDVSVSSGHYTVLGRKLPHLEASATLNRLRNRLTLIVINRHLQKSITAAINLSGYPKEPRVRACTITGPSIEADNDFTHPDTVKPVFSRRKVGSSFTFVPRSITSLEFSVR